MNLQKIAGWALRVQAPRATPRLKSRALSSTGAAPAGETLFETIWIKRDVYPIIFAVAVACFFCGGTILRYGLTHEEVQWDKKKKAASVAKWYEDKYPGTQSSCVTGVRH